MSQYLPFLMDQIFSRPHALAPSTANMIVAALSGRMDFRSLQSEFDRMDARALSDLAEMGRVQATERQAAEKDMPSLAPAQRELDWFDGAPPYRLTESGIAILPVKGVLKRSWGIGPFSGATGYDGLWTQLMHAEENASVKAIWFDINSGGGTVDGLFDLTDTIYTNSARFGGKPKYAMAADFCASAAYAIAAACDKVFTPELGMVGSIGCVILHAEFSEQLKEDGVNVTLFRSRDRKARGGPLEKLDQTEIDELQESCEEADAVFARQVGIYRPALTEKVISDLDGRLYTGERALATGLIDAVMSEPVAWMELEREIAQR